MDRVLEVRGEKKLLKSLTLKIEFFCLARETAAVIDENRDTFVTECNKVCGFTYC